jgi:hypothetical protein
MENILLVLDGTKPDKPTLEFACYIAGITRSKIQGLLGGKIKEHELPMRRELFALPYVETIVAGDIPENQRIMNSIHENEEWFGKACAYRDVNYSIRSQHKISVADVIRESRFADMLIINPEMSISSEREGSPTRFVKEILAGAECPVLLSPYSFDGISEIAFSYDGGEASIFAIKQFMHLFPELNSKTVSVIQISGNDEQPVKENEKIMQLLNAHYSTVKFVYLTGNPENELFNYLLGKTELFVVMGAFGRNPVSNLLRRSTAELSLKTINLPFFITHNIR